MFSSVLVANRGEIAVRITRTLRRIGIRSIAVYSEADVDSLHVHAADDALMIGPPSPSESYLDVRRVVDAAVRSGAEALHPGYGFLAESGALARACDEAGVVFIGPGADAIDAMGDKIRAREMVAAAGVPVVPGCSGAALSDEELAEAVVELGFPVLLKPSAGGGGKGMRLVTKREEVIPAIQSSRREALAAFGDDTLLAERFVARPRHIEVQIAADCNGNVVHLGERECSLQRRHQKIVEESPSPFVSPGMRARMGEQAIAVARACGYRNVGTVELIVSGESSDEFFFMEMNTRLQVEHPVTEEVYGIDLVELQLRLAAGERLSWTQGDLSPQGHSVEARVYAEDPAQGFLPTGGTIRLLAEPTGEGVRVDAGWRQGAAVGPSYDPMLAKIIATGVDRAEALDRLRRALARTCVLGLKTNVGYLQDLLDLGAVRAGDLDTGLVERTAIRASPAPDEVAVAAWLLRLRTDASDPWQHPPGWRLGGPTWERGEVMVDGDTIEVASRASAEGWAVSLGGQRPQDHTLEVGEAHLVVTSQQRRVRFDWADAEGGLLWLGLEGRSWPVEVVERHPVGRTRAAHGLGGPVVSPMPGTVVSLLVSVGDQVAAGDAVAVVEAMKMEHTLRAEVTGTVVGVHAAPGDQVAIKQVLVSVEVPAADLSTEGR